MLASAGLLYQMESMQLTALAGLESGFPPVLREAPGFDARRARLPILDLRHGGVEAPDPLLADLVFADLLTVRLPSVSHVELYPIRRLARPEEAAEDRGFAAMARVARRFLDAHLRRDAAAARALTDLAREPEGGPASVPDPSPVPLAVSHRPSLAPVPTEEELLLLVRTGQSAELRRVWEDARERGLAADLVAPELLRTAALFRLFDDGDPAGAAAALEILVELDPSGIEGWTLLGRARAAGGDAPGARRAYARARELLAAAGDLTADERRRLEERLARWSAQLEEGD
jgi:hypothetical protein